MSRFNVKTIGISILVLVIILISGFAIFGDFSDTNPTDPIDQGPSEYPAIDSETQYNEPPDTLSDIYSVHSSAVDTVSHKYTYTHTIDETQKVQIDTYYNYSEKELYKTSEFTGQETDVRMERYVDNNRVYVQQSTDSESESTVQSTTLSSEKSNFLITKTLSGSNYTGLTISHTDTVETESGSYYVYSVETDENSGDWESHTGEIVVSDTGVLVSYDVTSTLKSGEEYQHTYKITNVNPEFEVPLWVEGI